MHVHVVFTGIFNEDYYECQKEMNNLDKYNSCIKLCSGENFKCPTCGKDYNNKKLTLPSSIIFKSLLLFNLVVL